MKTKLYISALLACTLTMNTACSDFLTEDPQGKMIEDNYFLSQNDLDGAINILYSKVQRAIYGAEYSSPNWAGDDITALPGGNKDKFREFDSFKVNNNNAYLPSIWNSNFSIIKAANFILENVDKVPTTDEEIKIGKGQALFWKSVAYFRLVRWFGEVPLLQTTEMNLNVEKSSIEDVYKQICTDLEEAKRILPTSYDKAPRIADGLNNYVNKGSAQAVLAAVYMARAGYPLKQTEFYSKAAEMAKAVIDGVEDNTYYYTLEPNYKDRFMYQSNPYSQEGVVAVKFNRDNPWGWSGLDSWLAVTQAYESVTKGGWGDAVGEIKFWKEMPEGPRKDAIYGSDGGKIMVEKGDNQGKRINWYDKNEKGAYIVSECHPMFRTLLYGGGPVDTSKEYAGNQRGDYTDKEGTLNDAICGQTLYMVTYGEVLLWYAEASARSGSIITQEAKKALQQILDRAYGTGADNAENYTTPQAFADKCLKEHGYEVAGYFPALVARASDQLRMDDLKNTFEIRKANAPIEVAAGVSISESVPVTGSWSESRNYAVIPAFDADLNENL